MVYDFFRYSKSFGGGLVCKHIPCRFYSFFKSFSFHFFDNDLQKVRDIDVLGGAFLQTFHTLHTLGGEMFRAVCQHAGEAYGIEHLGIRVPEHVLVVVEFKAEGGISTPTGQGMQYWQPVQLTFISSR